MGYEIRGQGQGLLRAHLRTKPSLAVHDTFSPVSVWRPAVVCRLDRTLSVCFGPADAGRTAGVWEHWRRSDPSDMLRPKPDIEAVLIGESYEVNDLLYKLKDGVQSWLKYSFSY